jgi:uncharacterized protein YecT (DUF1311 family)
MTLRRLALSGLSLLCAGSAHAGVLDECWQRSSDRTQLGPCIQLAQSLASDDMLATFQKVEQQARALEKATGRESAVALLRTSQRDFERYVEGQCGFVHALFDSGTGADQAALACETDLLRQRTEVLRGLLPRSGAN